MHTIKNLYRKQFVVLSAYRPQFTDTENRIRTELLEVQLKTAGFQPERVKGFYKGSKEFFFIVPFSERENLDILCGIAFTEFHQESVLVHYASGAGMLLYSETETVRLGTDKFGFEVPKKEPIGHLLKIKENETHFFDGYTERYNGQFFTFK